MSVCVLSFEDLLCGNWVMCSQSGFITWEIQWSIFPYCPCSCPERTPQQPPLILSSLLPYPHHPSHIFTLWIYPASIQGGITFFFSPNISVLQIIRGRVVFNSSLRSKGFEGTGIINMWLPLSPFQFTSWQPYHYHPWRKVAPVQLGRKIPQMFILNNGCCKYFYCAFTAIVLVLGSLFSGLNGCGDLPFHPLEHW